jgi:hypothetical protein
MSKCGRCHGRGYIQRIRGIGHDECPACAGTGVKVQKSSLGSRSFSIPGPHGNCIVCGDPATEWHHVVSVQRIKRFVSEGKQQAALTDKRNLIPVDRACHEKIERALLELEPHELHPDFLAFVFGYDLKSALPRYLACGTAATTQSPSSQGLAVVRTLRPSREVPPR